MTLQELMLYESGNGYRIGLNDDIAIVDNATGDEYEYQVYYSEKLDRWELLIDTTPPEDHKAK